MTALILLMGGLQVAALVVRLLRKQWQAALLLAASAVMLLVPFVWTLLRGLPMTKADWNMLLLGAAAFTLALFSLWRPLRLVFWLGWLLNAWLVAVLFYLAFFWHPFG